MSRTTAGRLDEKMEMQPFYAFLSMEGVGIYLMICLTVNDFIFREAETFTRKCLPHQHVNLVSEREQREGVG